MTKNQQVHIGGQLPSPKGVALAIMELSRREDVTLKELARVVQTDPALSSRLLRLVNAAQIGRTVTSLGEAVMHLGMTTVRDLAMGFSLVDQYLQGSCAAFDYAAFWSRSLFMAVACQELSRLVRVGSPDELFACGLLAQIGQLALATMYPDDYAAILAEPAGAEPLLVRERQQLGMDHCELTAVILADCGMPKGLVDTACCHEVPETAGFIAGSRAWRLVHLFSQARLMAELALAPAAEREHRRVELICLGGNLGLDAAALAAAFDRVAAQWREWGALLNVPATPPPAFNAMATAPIPAPSPARSQTASAPPKRVLLVEDEVTSRMKTEAVLRHAIGCTVYTAENGEAALALALEVMPQIVITDWLMPVMDGLAFCQALRATEWGKSMYVIMLTGMETEERIVEAFEAGVDDYVAKPMNVRALNARMRAALHYVDLLDAWERDRMQLERFAAELAIGNRRLEHMAMTDLLTGLPNRRAGMEALDKAWGASTRSAQSMAVLMIDVDRFKAINDRYGHAVGDQVLQAVAHRIQAAARKDESVSRIGGEEFLLVCHNADIATALVAAERLRSMVKDLEIGIGDLAIQVSVSIGVACREADMTDADAMVRAADQALYAAKNGGRDRVCFLHRAQCQCAQA